jgi:hypothetical protein
MSDTLKDFDKRYNVAATIAGLALSFAAFKDELKLYEIPLVFGNVSLSWLFLFALGALFFSLWLYVISSVILLPRWPQLKFIQYVPRFAHFMFVLTLLSPIFVALLWLADLAVSGVQSLDEAELDILGSILTALSAFAAGIASRTLWNAQKQTQSEFLREREGSELASAKVLLTTGHHRAAIIEAFRALDLFLIRELLQRGYDVKQIPPRVMLTLAASKGVLTIELARELNRLRELRNKAAHGEAEMDKLEVARGVELIESVIVDRFSEFELGRLSCNRSR